MDFEKKINTFLFGTFRSVCYGLRSMWPTAMPEPHPTQEVDVVIPIVKKDLQVLPVCLEGIRHNVRNRIGHIYIVAPRDEEIVQFAATHDAVFVDEESVLGYGPQAIGYHVGALNRSGWVFQQLLKLSGAVGSNRYFVTIDSDHVLVSPVTFLTADEKCVFYMSKEYYFPYYRLQRSLLGSMPRSALSYVAHKMVFDKEELHRLHATIERHGGNGGNGSTWDKLIINAVKTVERSSFSEFETYGSLFPAKRKRCMPWRDITLVKTRQLIGYDELHERYSGRYLSVTFPDYLRKE